MVESMPDVTSTPVLIDPSAAKSGQVGTGVCSQGWYKTASGNLYQVLSAQFAPFFIGVFKSTDGGKTWTQMDIANRPATGIFPFYYCVFDPIGEVIYFNWMSGSTAKWWKFTCGTDTFTATIVPDLLAINYTGPPKTLFGRRSNGNLFAIVTNGAGTADLGFKENVGGVWSAYTRIINEAFAHTVQILMIDALDNVYLIYGRGGGTQTWFYVMIDNLNGVGAPQQIEAGAGTTDDVFNTGVLAFNSIFAPLVRGQGAGAFSKSSVMIGTPLNAPVWTVVDLDTQGRFDIISNGVVFDNVKVVCLWALNNGVVNNITRADNIGAGFG